MAQHDYNLVDQPGASFRTDLNNALSATVTLNSGATEPSTTFAYMMWADTNTGLLKIRNAANNAWVSIRSLASAHLDVALGGTGATTPAAARESLNIETTATGSTRIASGTTAQRDGTPNAGFFRFNSTTGQFEGHNGAAWGAVGGGATGGTGNAAFYENDTTISADYTIGTNKNAMTAGPITINNGITITVPPGSVWTIV
jgi:hypothetical protein